MNLQDIHYVNPTAAYFLTLLFFFLWLIWSLYQYRQNKSQEFGTKSVRETMFTPKRSSTLYWSKSIAFCLAWVFATFALMQPISYGHYPEEIARPSSMQTIEGQRRRKAHEVMILIDASASMTVPDARSGHTRFDIAKDIADGIVRRLTGEAVSLNAFTSEVAQLAPPTTDYLYVRMVLRQMNINEGGFEGTNLIHAMEEMRKKNYNESTNILKTLILLTDGGDTQIETLQGAEKEQAINTLLSTIQDAAKNHLRVYTIGIGSQTPSTIPKITFDGSSVLSAVNQDLLRRISQVGRGRYYFANDFAALDLAVTIEKDFSKERPTINMEDIGKIETSVSTDDNLIHRRYFQIPLGLAMILLAAVLLLPDTWSMRVFRRTPHEDV